MSWIRNPFFPAVGGASVCVIRDQGGAAAAVLPGLSIDGGRRGFAQASTAETAVAT